MQVQLMTHKDFMLELPCQLWGTDKAGVPLGRRADHVPVPIHTATDTSQKATRGRLRCKYCLHVDNRRSDTSCDVLLCLSLDRNK